MFKSTPLKRIVKSIHRMKPWIFLIVFSGSADAMILDVQILGHGADVNGGPDPQPPSYQGAAVIGTEHDHWNGVIADAFGHPLTINPPGQMIAADGKTPTDVTVSFANFTGADYFPVNQGAPVSNNLLNSYLVGGADASLTIEGLIPDSSYNLLLFGSNSHAGAGAKFTVNGSNSQSTQGTGVCVQQRD
jgi:hypothetical protein